MTLIDFFPPLNFPPNLFPRNRFGWICFTLIHLLNSKSFCHWFFKKWNIVDPQYCLSLWCVAKWFCYTYIRYIFHVYICHTYFIYIIYKKNIYKLFFIVGYKILNKVPCMCSRTLLSICFIYSSLCLLTPNSWLVPPPLSALLIVISLFSALVGLFVL